MLEVLYVFQLHINGIGWYVLSISMNYQYHGIVWYRLLLLNIIFVRPIHSLHVVINHSHCCRVFCCNYNYTIYLSFALFIGTWRDYKFGAILTCAARNIVVHAFCWTYEHVYIGLYLNKTRICPALSEYCQNSFPKCFLPFLPGI